MPGVSLHFLMRSVQMPGTMRLMVRSCSVPNQLWHAFLQRLRLLHNLHRVDTLAI